MVNDILKFVRFDHWFTQKLSPLLVVAYAVLWANGIAPAEAFAVLPLVLLCICSVAAYGHVINDWFDLESDAASAKANTLEGVSLAARVSLTALFLAAGFGSVLAIDGRLAMVWILAVNYLLPTIYSVPRIRLKHRGVAGVFSDAMAAHFLPTLFVLVAFGELANGALSGLGVSALVWASCLGLRGILIHQAIDRDADRAAGLKTFATPRSRKTIRRIVVGLIVPIEVAGLVAFVPALPSFSAPLALALTVFALGEIARVARGLKMPMVYVQEVGRETYVPLVSNELYEVWLPMALVIQLAMVNAAYLPLVLIHLVVFRAPILRTAAMLARYAKGAAGGFA